MGRGKIEIKKIENQTKRQVTYSKRRNGIFKKAQELTVLCDAKVSIIMVSRTGKLHEFISPSITTKQIYDQYQKVLGVDIWITHYQRMQATLSKLKDINHKLRREISHRMGHGLDDLSIYELRDLEQNMRTSADAIRERKLHDITTKKNTSKKKVNSLEQRNRDLLFHLGASYEDQQQYGLVENDPDFESTITVAIGVPPNLYALSLHGHHQNVHHNGGTFGFNELRIG